MLKNISYFRPLKLSPVLLGFTSETLTRIFFDLFEICFCYPQAARQSELTCIGLFLLYKEIWDKLSLRVNALPKP